MKKILMFVLMLCLLCGCAATPGDPTGTNPAPTEPETVTVYINIAQHIEYTMNGETGSMDIKVTLDENDRPIRFVQTNGNGEVEQSVTYEYDEEGKQIKQTVTMGGSAIDYTITYDENDRLLTQEATMDGQPYQTYHYIYNENGQQLTMEFVYHTAAMSVLYKYEYEGERMTKLENYQNGELYSTDLYSYNDQGKVTRVVKTLSDGTVAGDDQYTYSDDGLTCTVQGLNQKTVAVRDQHDNLLSQTVEGEDFRQVTTYEYKAVEVPADDPRVK